MTWIYHGRHRQAHRICDSLASYYDRSRNDLQKKTHQHTNQNLIKISDKPAAETGSIVGQSTNG